MENKRDPDSVIVLNNLAHTISEQGRPEEPLPITRAAASGPYADAVAQTRKTILERISKNKR